MPDPRGVDAGRARLAGRRHHARRRQGPGRPLPGRGEHGGRPRGAAPTAARRVIRTAALGAGGPGRRRRHRAPPRRRAAACSGAPWCARADRARRSRASCCCGPPSRRRARPRRSAVPLEFAAVRDYDPQGADQSERPDLRGAAIDGDPETAWYTENYQVTPEFGGLKDGVGPDAAPAAPGGRDRDDRDLAHAGRALPGARARPGRPARGAGRGRVHRRPAGRAAGAGARPPRPTSSGSPCSSPDGQGRYWAGVGEVELRGVPNST